MTTNSSEYPTPAPSDNGVAVFLAEHLTRPHWSEDPEVLDDLTDAWPDSPLGWFHYSARYGIAPLVLQALRAAGYEITRPTYEGSV